MSLPFFINLDPIKPYARLIAGVFICAVVSVALYKTYHAGFDSCKSDWDAAEAKRAKAEQSAAWEQAKKQDRIVTDLLDREQTLQKINGDLKNVLSKTTTGRQCLNAGTVRLLNSGTGIHLSEHQPGAAPENAREFATDTNDLGSTDTQIAGWIADAQQQYATCAGRLNDLIDATNWESVNAR